MVSLFNMLCAQQHQWVVMRHAAFFFFFFQQRKYGARVLTVRGNDLLVFTSFSYHKLNISHLDE